MTNKLKMNCFYLVCSRTRHTQKTLKGQPLNNEWAQDLDFLTILNKT